MKTYPLKVEELCDRSCDFSGYFSRGHHEAADFISIVNKLEADDTGDDDFFTDDYVNHEWWRAIPVKGYDWDFLWVRAEAGSRGAFPVTVVYI